MLDPRRCGRLPRTNWVFHARFATDRGISYDKSNQEETRWHCGLCCRVVGSCTRAADRLLRTGGDGITNIDQRVAN